MLNLIKIILSILLLGCLFQLPYGYYMLVRYLALAGFTALAYLEFMKTNEKLALSYVILALLFQPIFKIALNREIWIIIDILVATGLIFSMFYNTAPSKK